MGRHRVRSWTSCVGQRVPLFGHIHRDVARLRIDTGKALPRPRGDVAEASETVFRKPRTVAREFHSAECATALRIRELESCYPCTLERLLKTRLSAGVSFLDAHRSFQGLEFGCGGRITALDN